MKKPMRVVVWGVTLHMAGLAASLRAEASLDVVCVDPRAPHARQSLSDLHPAAILFDVSDPSPCMDVALLREEPGLILIGVDPRSDKMLVLSGRRERPVSAAELAQVIRGGSALGPGAAQRRNGSPQP